MPKKILQNAPGTNELRIYISVLRQPSWADPGTVFRTQKVSRGRSSGSTVSFMKSWPAPAFHRALSNFQMWILKWGSSEFFPATGKMVRK